MSSYATLEELKAYRQLYLETKKSLPAGEKSLISSVVRTMSETQPFTHDDLEGFFDPSKKSCISQSRVMIAEILI
jgi:hypothetical protein